MNGVAKSILIDVLLQNTVPDDVSGIAEKFF